MNSSAFDMLGAEEVKPKFQVSWTRTTLAVVAGGIAAVLNKKHPVLAALLAAAAASNAHAVATGDRTLKVALRRMGRHVVATAGSLSIPKYPAMGYAAGAVAGDLLIDADDGGGFIDEWTNYANSKPARGEVIDADFVEVQAPPTTTAMVKQ